MKELLLEVQERFSIFPEMYEILRLVNIKDHKAYTISENSSGTEELISSTCYDFWERGRECNNCIVQYVTNTGKPTMKIEIKGNITFIIQAYPIRWKKKTYILEMIRKMSDQELLFSKEEGHAKGLSTYLQEMDDKLYIDALTQVHNRRYIDDYLPKTIEKSRQENKYIALMITDIDGFKRINDSYGHLVGDCLLEKLAHKYKEAFNGENDWVARYGGDEFMLLYYDVTIESINDRMNAMKKEIVNEIFQCGENEIQITCSYGICINMNCEWGFYDLIEIADKSLYEAKKLGKDKIIMCTE